MRNLVFVGLLLSGMSSLAGVVGSVSAVQGKASATRDGKSIVLKVKDKLEAGDQLKTGAASLMLIQLYDGSLHKMGEQSNLTLSDKGERTLLEILSGSLFSLFKVSKNKDGKKKQYRIKTKTMVAGVRGTQFFTSYGRNKRPNDNWLCVNEGEVEVSLIGEKKKTIVKAGQGISVTKKKGVSAPKPLPWTKKLNWSMDPKKDLVNKVDIESAYTDLLDVDYD